MWYCIFPGRLEVTLEKQVEGVDWKYLLKDSSRSEGADTHYPLNQGLGDELSSEKLEEMLSGNAVSSLWRDLQDIIYYTWNIMVLGID